MKNRQNIPEREQNVQDLEPAENVEHLYLESVWRGWGVG